VSHGAASLASDSFSWSRIRQIGFSIADQGFSVGGMFLASIALARTQTKEEYGIFVLTYSVFTFLVGLHNAAILEAYTIYGSGRYHEHFPAYARQLWHSNLLLGFGLTVALVLGWRVLGWTTPAFAPRTVLGMALTCGILLTASFIRRTFYIRRRPDLAAKFSLAYLLSSAVLLWFCVRAGILNGFYAFLIAAVAWSLGGLVVARELPGAAGRSFNDLVPRYWVEHWNYSRWVFVTALVFQFTNQGYYWLAAGFLSVKEVADLRAMYNVVTPVEQIFVATALLILPMMSYRYVSSRVAGLVPLWRTYCLGCVVVTCGFAALISAIGKPLMHVLYAGKFDEIAPLVGLLGLLPVITGIGNTVNAALKAMEKSQAVFWAYAVSGATTFLAGLPLVMHFKLRGAVYGLLVSGAAYTLTLGVAFFFFVQAGRHAVPLAAAAKGDSLVS
jgi:O-antigen/teichoic acid export membrane protein